MVRLMWHEYIAYFIIVVAFCWVGRRVYRFIRHPEDSSACASCTADCKLRGLKRPTRKEKQRNCTKKEENAHK